MNEEIKKNAIQLRVLPMIQITEEDTKDIPNDEWIQNENGYFRFDCTLSNEEVLLLTELKKCKFVKTIRNIAFSVALLIVAYVAACIYYFSTLGSILK